MASDATDAAGEGRPCLEQRFSALLTVRTTLHDDGLVVQVARPFSERVGAVDFGRLLPEPASVSGLPAPRLWAGAVLLAASAAACLPPLRGMLGAASGPLAIGLLAAAACACIAAVAAPRRLTLLLDRERALNPVFLRGREDDAQVEEFLARVRRAAIAWRCRAPGEDAAAPGAAPLSATLDALQAMRAEGLIEAREFERFRELAVNRR